MKNAQERIEWVLRFVEMDLSRLRQGDWLNLEEDIRAFVQRFESWPLTPREKDVLALQKEARNVLRAVAFANTQPSDPGVHMVQGGIRKSPAGMSHSFNLSPDADAVLTFEFQRAGDFPLRFWSTNLTDAFLFALAATLSQLDVTYIRTCQRPACSRLFLAEHGRQRFCSPQCASREGTRRFRAKNREQENERGKENYEKKVKRKLGYSDRGRVKIGKQSTQRKEV